MKQAAFKLIYNGKNITGDISSHVTGFTYTDKTGKETDDLQISLQDSEDFWKLAWYPSKGDKIEAEIISEGEILPCGSFTVDEVSSDGGPGGDVFTIRAIAAGINIKSRTKKTYAHEKKTLREIANTVARNLGLTLKGSIADIRIDRLTQRKETDLHFLQRVANEYGYSFSVRGTDLIFTDIFELEKGPAVVVIDRGQLNSWTLNDKTSGTFSNVRVRYHDHRSKSTVEFSGVETNKAFTTKGDALELHVRAENRQQAEIKGKVALYRHNSKTQSGGIGTHGNVRLLAGNNFELTGIGAFNGRWHIESSTHNIDGGGGYTTDCQIKRVGFKE